MPLRDSTTLTQEGHVLSVGVLPTDSIPPWSQNPSDKFTYTTTGSSRTPTLPIEEEMSLVVLAPNFIQGTIGTIEYSNYLQILTQLDLTRPAREAIRSITNRTISNHAERLLLIIRTRFENLEDVNNFPPIRAFESDDGSLLIEWIFNRFRIGFSIELDDEESGWYLVSDSKLGDIFAYGSLFNQNMHKLIAWLLAFVMTNYAET